MLKYSFMILAYFCHIFIGGYVQWTPKHRVCLSLVTTNAPLKGQLLRPQHVTPSCKRDGLTTLPAAVTRTRTNNGMVTHRTWWPSHTDSSKSYDKGHAGLDGST